MREGGREGGAVRQFSAHSLTVKQVDFSAVFLAAAAASLWTGDFCIHLSRLKGYSTQCLCNVLTPLVLKSFFTARLCDCIWMPIQAICVQWHAFLHPGLIFISRACRGFKAPSCQLKRTGEATSVQLPVCDLWKQELDIRYRPQRSLSVSVQVSALASGEAWRSGPSPELVVPRSQPILPFPPLEPGMVHLVPRRPV